MPVIVEPRENGRVLYVGYSDPWTIKDMADGHIQQKTFYDVTPYDKVHLLLDVSNAHTMPPGIMRARMETPELTHPKSGYMAIVGAAPLLKAMADVILRLARFKRAQFFSTVEDGWGYLRDVIAKESMK